MPPGVPEKRCCVDLSDVKVYESTLCCVVLILIEMLGCGPMLSTQVLVCCIPVLDRYIN